MITGNHNQGTAWVKHHLCCHFQMKYLGRLQYFLAIEVAQSKKGIVISQRKYVMDIQKDTGLMGAKPADTPMDLNAKLLSGVTFRPRKVLEYSNLRESVGNM
ncbi:putative mitochondrial protein, partial [Mucuna pruriens]